MHQLQRFMPFSRTLLFCNLVTSLKNIKDPQVWITIHRIDELKFKSDVKNELVLGAGTI